MHEGISTVKTAYSRGSEPRIYIFIQVVRAYRRAVICVMYIVSLPSPRVEVEVTRMMELDFLVLVHNPYA